MCQDIDTGGVSPQNLPVIVRAEQTPDTADTVTCNPRPGLNVFMNAAATISTSDHRSGGGWGWLGLVSGGGWKS